MNTKLITLSMFTMFCLSACELDVQATLTKKQIVEKVSCLNDNSCTASLAWDENPAEEKVDYYTVEYAPESTGADNSLSESVSINVGKNTSATLLNLGDSNYQVRITAHRGSESKSSEALLVGPSQFND